MLQLVRVWPSVAQNAFGIQLRFSTSCVQIPPSSTLPVVLPGTVEIKYQSSTGFDLMVIMWFRVSLSFERNPFYAHALDFAGSY